MTIRNTIHIVDGKRVQPTLLSGDQIIGGVEGPTGPVIIERGHLRVRGKYTGGIGVEGGATATLDGHHTGSLSLDVAAAATIRGQQSGSVNVAPDATLTVYGTVSGSSTVEVGGTIVVEHGGRLCGSMTNDGLVILRGGFGGSRSGDGELRVEDGGYIKVPTVDENGIATYVW